MNSENFIIKSISLILVSLFSISFLSAQNQVFIQTEQALEDIEFMINSIEEVHYNPYFKVDKDEFDDFKDDLLEDFSEDSISLKLFISTGLKLSAKLSGGHTAMDWQNNQIIPELMDYRFIPFTGKILEDDSTFVVTRSVSEDIKEGEIIKSINDISIIELYRECLSYLGGIESFKRTNLEAVFPLYFFFTNKLTYPYQIELTEETISMAGIDVIATNDFLNSGEVVDNYTFSIVNNDIGVIYYNSCTNYDAFEIFLSQTFKEIEEKKISKLIIDIRRNSGGDSSLNDLLLSYITRMSYRQSSGRFWKVSHQSKEVYNDSNYEDFFGADFMKLYDESDVGSILETLNKELIIPEKPLNYFTGRTCFLIGPGTFSSANFLADAIKTYNISTLIGSATGELTNDFGEVIHIVLPNSGNYVYVSSTYDIGANGDSTLLTPVEPDVEINENVLEFAIKWINTEAKHMKE